MIKVSINCVTYNHEKYIRDALDSFLSQKTNFEFEILVHDDASLDKTTKIIEKYQKKHPKIIKPIYQKSNQYSQGKRIFYEFNHKRAIGKYVAMCEGDDYWTDNYKLQKQFDYMENDTNCTICVHSVEIINNLTKRQNEIHPFKENSKFNLSDYLKKNLFLSTSSIFYRKKAFDNPPKFFLDATVGDTPLKMILLKHGHGYYLDEVMSTYRKNIKGSWSNIMKVEKNKRIAHEINMIAFLKHFDIYTEYVYQNLINDAITNREQKIIIEKIKMNSNEFFSEEFRKLKFNKKIDIFYKAIIKEIILKLISKKDEL